MGRRKIRYLVSGRIIVAVFCSIFYRHFGIFAFFPSFAGFSGWI